MASIHTLPLMMALGVTWDNLWLLPHLKISPTKCLLLCLGNNSSIGSGTCAVDLFRGHHTDDQESGLGSWPGQQWDAAGAQWPYHGGP